MLLSLARSQNLSRAWIQTRFNSAAKAGSNPISTSKQHKDKTVAVVLSGCGFKDGSEIHEAVSVLIGISQTGATYKCFAPNVNQRRTVNHLTGETVDETRNVLVEAARIARGEIQDLSALNAEAYDCIILPGGFGAALNLSNFAVSSGGDTTVDSTLEKILKDFHTAKKPIGLCCISPIIAAKVFPGVKVTIGNDAPTIERIEAMESLHIEKKVDEVHIDKENLIVTTPAYMLDQPIHKVLEGVIRMVNNVLQLSIDKHISEETAKKE